MNEQTRLIVSALFIIIILLAVAITRFYSDTTQSTGNNSYQISISEELSKDSSGNRIFMNESGMYGIADKNSHVIVPPEWLGLKFADGNICIASADIGGRNLTGCIDYEGNIIIPFIYQSIEKNESEGYVFYSARSAQDGSYVLYDNKFSVIFSQSWSKFSFRDDTAVLSDSIGNFTYSVNENGFRLREAELSGEVLSHPYSVKITSQVILSKLTVPALEKIISCAVNYIDYAYTGNQSVLDRYCQENISSFLQLFPDDSKIISKQLMNISEMYVYTSRSDDGIPHYKVSVKADTKIVYSDEYFTSNTIYDDYKAIIEFCGSTSADINAVSASFMQSVPDYPVPEIQSVTADENGQAYVADSSVAEENLKVQEEGNLWKKKEK